MEPGVELVERMLKATGLRKISDLAKILGLRPHAISNWKVRGVPRGELYKLSHLTGISVDWLENGEGPMRADHRWEGGKDIDVQRLASVIAKIDEFLVETGQELDSNQKAQAIAQLYSRTEGTDLMVVQKIVNEFFFLGDPGGPE